MSVLKTTTRIVLPLLLIALALGTGWFIVKTTKKPEKKRPQRTAYAVEVVPLLAGKHTVRLQATGTVTPAQEITLRARVTGEVVAVAPELIEGGAFKQGEHILTIDPVDYQLALERKRAALAEADYQLILEKGRGEIAAREWELIDISSDATRTDRDLAMRIPHLKYRTAQLAAAKAELEKAELDLARTEIRAPFSAVVVTRQTDLGAQVTMQDSLARLVNTDSFYVRASVPVDRLRWMVCDPENGSSATITRSSGDVRQGRVVRLESSIEEQGRMARVLIEVADPLQGTQPMLLNEYVRIVIEGSAIESAYSIPRSALHDDRSVWLATPQNTLEIRDVDVVWRDANVVLVREGLKGGERLVRTNLSTPVNGMKLRIVGDPMPEKKGNRPREERTAHHEE